MAETRVSAVRWSAVGVLGLMLAVAGYWLLFTTFMLYDDEGYVILSAQNFSLHGGLYDRVYTQYGPFFYVFYDALHRVLGFAFDNTSARWLTLVNWLGTALLCAALVGRVTRSALWCAFTLAGTFTYLWVMINEPMHPGGLVAGLMAGGVWLSAEAWRKGYVNRFATITALTGAALLLVKINVGVFFLGATFAWFAVNASRPAVGRALTWLAALGCAALPFGLMHSLFAETWVRLFALLFASAGLAVLLVTHRTARPIVGLQNWIRFGVVFTGSTVVILLITLARGTSLRGLVEGVALAPLKHPGVYFFAMNWRTGTGALALASLGLAAFATRRSRSADSCFPEFISWIRLAVAAVFLCSPFRIIPTSIAAWVMCYGISLTWIFAFSVRPVSNRENVGGWLALVLVFQFLHAYPVAGSQTNWGTFLWVPLLAIGLHDAAPVLRKRLGALNTTAVRLGSTAIIAVTVLMTAQLAFIGGKRYLTTPGLALPGAESLHLPNAATYALRITDENIRAHADMLFSFPGIFSANLRTGLPTPTLGNVTHWFSLLTEPRQGEIIDQLARSPRPVLLVQRELLDYLSLNHFPTNGPLHTWLMANFEPALAIDGYEIWVRRGRKIAALSTARFLGPLETVRAATLTLRAPNAPIARIELCDVSQPRVPILTFNAGNTTAELTSCGLDGRPNSPPTPIAFPLTFNGVAHITLHFAAIQLGTNSRAVLFVLRDANGAVVGEVRSIE